MGRHLIAGLVAASVLLAQPAVLLAGDGISTEDPGPVETMAATVNPAPAHVAQLAAVFSAVDSQIPQEISAAVSNPPATDPLPVVPYRAGPDPNLAGEVALLRRGRVVWIDNIGGATIRIGENNVGRIGVYSIGGNRVRIVLETRLVGEQPRYYDILGLRTYQTTINGTGIADVRYVYIPAERSVTIVLEDARGVLYRRTVTDIPGIDNPQSMVAPLNEERFLVSADVGEPSAGAAAATMEDEAMFPTAFVDELPAVDENAQQVAQRDVIRFNVPLDQAPLVAQWMAMATNAQDALLYAGNILRGVGGVGPPEPFRFDGLGGRGGSVLFTYPDGSRVEFMDNNRVSDIRIGLPDGSEILARYEDGAITVLRRIDAEGIFVDYYRVPRP